MTTKLGHPSIILTNSKQKIKGRCNQMFAEIEEFRGIPYGFALARWTHSIMRNELPSDEFDAARDGPKCPQPDFVNNTDTYQSYLDFPNPGEDELNCLNLFIIRPSADALDRLSPGLSQQLLPVLLWIHGGGFGFGAGTDPIWDPARLVNESLRSKTPFIAVNINYRLGIFGMAASSDLLICQQRGGAESAIRGCNYGLRDQYVALNWVSQNIAAFGGDPSKITLGGQSAGAKSAHIHALQAKYSPAQPLFRKVLPMSGAIGCIGPMSLRSADERWEMLLRRLNCARATAKENVEALRQVSSQELLHACLSMGWVTYPVVTDNLTLCDVLDVPGGVDFAQNEALKTTSDPSTRPIEVMMGETEDEAIVFTHHAKLDDAEAVQRFFHQGFPSAKLANSLLEAYSLQGDVSAAVLRTSVTQFLTDTIFAFNVYLARRHFTCNKLVNSTSNGATIDDANRTTNETVDVTSKTKAGSQKTKSNFNLCYHQTTLHPYRIKFGNAFAGPSYGTSHHCVDLIYLFDNFHDDLEKHDQHPLTQGCDALKKCMASRVANAEIRRTLQSRVIDFITNDAVTGASTLREAKITIWDFDGTVTEQGLLEFEEQTGQRMRYDLIAQYPAGTQYVREKITGEQVGAEPAAMEEPN